MRRRTPRQRRKLRDDLLGILLIAATSVAFACWVAFTVNGGLTR